MSLRIFAISNRYLPVVGGAERQLALLASALKERGHQITIITRHISDTLPFHETIDDIPVYRLRPTGLGKLANALIIPRLITYLLANRNHFDIIHCQSIGPAAIASVIAGQLLNKPVILRVATAGDIARQRIHTKTSAYTNFMRRYIVTPKIWHGILNKADTIIALSQELVEEAQENNIQTPVINLGNGVNTQVFHPISQAMQNNIRVNLGLPINIPILFTTGRLVERKRLDVLIDAMPYIIQNNPDTILLIAGSGSYQADSVEGFLKEQVKTLNLGNHVQFLGLIDNVADYLKASNVFVFPSAKEGMPNAVLEAMAAGKPIVASRIGGVVDLVDDSCAYLLPVGDVNGFAQSIIEALAQPDIASAKATQAQKRVQTHFSVEAIADAYLKLYHALLRSN